MALGPIQPFSPISSSFSASQLNAVSSNVAGATMTGTSASLPTGGGIPAGAIIKGLQLGLQAFSLFNTLGALADQKAGIVAKAAFNRKIARENAAQDIFKIEITAFRTLKRITAQASSGGFSGASQSTLAIKNQQQNDSDRLEIQVNKNLLNTLTEIQRIESEERRRNRGLKTKAITGFATSILGG